jgi:hypothetical protein
MSAATEDIGWITIEVDDLAVLLRAGEVLNLLGIRRGASFA